MGEVYLAEEIELKRNVALKIINNPLTADQNTLSRFKREASVLTTLKHKNIVQIYRYGIVNQNIPYLAMELLSGTTLSNVIQERGNLPAREAAKIASEVASAISYVHSYGVVHRDLKPSNVFVTREGQIKLIDFGLCKLIPDDASEVQKLTQTGLLIGSAHYMSPELCQGKAADTGADIYALGVMFFEMLTGKPPFDYENVIGLLQKHFSDPVPSLATLYPAMPECRLLDNFLKRCLAKTQAERFGTMTEVEEQLRLMQEQLPAELAPLVPQVQDKRKKYILASAVILSLLIVGSIAILVGAPEMVATLLNDSKKSQPLKDRVQSLSAYADTLDLFSLHRHAEVLRAKATNSSPSDSYSRCLALAYMAAAQERANRPEAIVNAKSALRECARICTAKSETSTRETKEEVEQLIATTTIACRVLEDCGVKWDMTLDAIAQMIRRGEHKSTNYMGRASKPLHDYHLHSTLKQKAQRPDRVPLRELTIAYYEAAASRMSMGDTAEAMRLLSHGVEAYRQHMKIGYDSAGSLPAAGYYHDGLLRLATVCANKGNNAMALKILHALDTAAPLTHPMQTMIEAQLIYLQIYNCVGQYEKAANCIKFIRQQEASLRKDMLSANIPEVEVDRCIKQIETEVAHFEVMTKSGKIKTPQDYKDLHPELIPDEVRRIFPASQPDFPSTKT